MKIPFSYPPEPTTNGADHAHDPEQCAGCRRQADLFFEAGMAASLAAAKPASEAAGRAAYVVIDRAEVPDKARPRGGSRKGKVSGISQFVAAIMAGETVFIADINQATSWIGSARLTAGRHGLRTGSRRMHRDGLGGFAVWAEQPSHPPSGEGG